MINMEVKEDTYILGTWFLEQEDVGNLLMTAYKDSKDATIWKSELRVRSYVDNRTFGSEDIKKSYDRDWKDGTTEQAVIADCEHLMSLYQKAYKTCAYDFVEIRGDGDKMTEALSKCSWANMKKVDKNNPDDVRWAEENGIDIQKGGE